MATNIIYDRIFKGLKAILKSKNRVFVRGEKVPTRSNEFVRLSLESSPFQIENTGPTSAMRYTVYVDFITNHRENTRYVTQSIADISDILNDNPCYSSGGVYYWHDGVIQESEFGPADEDEYAARLVWSATHTEIKS